MIKPPKTLLVMVGLVAVMLFFQSASPVVAKESTAAGEPWVEVCEGGAVEPASLDVADEQPNAVQQFFSGITDALKSLKKKKGAVYTCTGGNLPAGSGQDLLVTGTCVANGQVPKGKYDYHNVNIVTASGSKSGGSLVFEESPNSAIKFYAESILVEAGGSLIAGTPSNPIGSEKGSVEIHLWGASGDAGIKCQSPGGTCGVPSAIWTSNNTNTLYPSSGNSMTLGNGVTDYFYEYQTFDTSDGSNPAYFGHKVLAVSYGGTLQLFGKRGATICDPAQPKSAACQADADPSNTGTSWAHLNASLSPAATSLTVDRAVDWEPGDQIVVTTTDYVAAHSETVTIANVQGQQITLKKTTPIQYPHNGVAYSLASHNVPAGTGPQTASGTNESTIETRAAVALLSRSIKVVSEGDNANTSFDKEPANYYFGGHTIARQGFNSFQIQGVEFDRLGQGGSKGHYAVHFHMVRQAPPNTFVKDSSVNESMTRWYTIHASSQILLARNVGYRSIGHGYYLEDGSETGNKLYGNIGVFARSATASGENPRNVPGILVAPDFPASGPTDGFGTTGYQAEYVDAVSPTIFWIMNGENDFEYNTAVGAGACGACYWLVPAAVSGPSMYEYWTGYAGEQVSGSTSGPYSRAGLTPLQEFFHNSCSTAMTSVQTVGQTSPCFGVALSDGAPFQKALISASAPTPGTNNAIGYYPNTSNDRFPTICSGTGCNTVAPCAAGNLGNCAVTVLDHFTSAFNWAQENYSAIWLRINWYLFSNSALTDVQNAGLTIVTGGGYSDSDAPPGYWSLARDSVFVGNTQPCDLTGTCTNPFASNAGPFNPATASWKNAKGQAAPLQCDTPLTGDRCVSGKNDITMQLAAFGVNQRLFNIYDGPSYQDANAYLDTNVTPLDCSCSGTADGCQSSQYIYPRVLGVPRAQQALQKPTPLTQGQGYLPNAAIAWKQPNGFFYPPAFHSSNLYFDNVDLRHFVIEPLFNPGTFVTNPTEAYQTYCTTGGGTLFNNFTDIDRQTVLLDDDGSLTGLIGTTSVNDDAFFNAPVETSECASNVGVGPEAALQATATAKSSPYQYVTTAMYPDCALSGYNCGTDMNSNDLWNVTSTNPSSYGVPLYRQLLIKGESSGASIMMMGQSDYQRSTLTINNGTYYMDTSVSDSTQLQGGYSNLSVFQSGQKYYVYDLFAKPDTKQTFELYVGKTFNKSDTNQLSMVQVDPVTMPGPTITPLGALPSAWTTSLDSTGILTITMDMSISSFQTNYTQELKSLCQPNSFCALQSNNSCGCNLTDNPNDPYQHDLYQQCKADASGVSPICHFAQEDVKCPAGGCYGFAVTLAPDFSNAQSVPPPKALCLHASGPFDAPFTPASSSVAGACLYSSAPLGTFCN